MRKLRVWWIAQLGIDKSFYVPVENETEGKKILDILAAYDGYQLEQKVKGDYCNTGGLQYFNEESQEWCEWFLETENDYFDDLDDYCESELCEDKDKLENFTKEVLGQVDWNNL